MREGIIVKIINSDMSKYWPEKGEKKRLCHGTIGTVLEVIDRGENPSLKETLWVKVLFEEEVWEVSEDILEVIPSDIKLISPLENELMDMVNNVFNTFNSPFSKVNMKIPGQESDAD